MRKWYSFYRQRQRVCFARPSEFDKLLKAAAGSRSHANSLTNNPLSRTLSREIGSRTPGGALAASEDAAMACKEKEPVIQADPKTGEEVHFESLEKAAEYMGVQPATMAWHAIDREYKGFHWRYAKTDTSKRTPGFSASGGAFGAGTGDAFGTAPQRAPRKALETRCARKSMPACRPRLELGPELIQPGSNAQGASSARPSNPYQFSLQPYGPPYGGGSVSVGESGQSLVSQTGSGAGASSEGSAGGGGGGGEASAGRVKRSSAEISGCAMEKNSHFDAALRSVHKARPVIQLSIETGEEVNRFASLTKAAEHAGVAKSSMLKFINEGRDYKGCRWMYVDRVQGRSHGDGIDRQRGGEGQGAGRAGDAGGPEHDLGPSPPPPRSCTERRIGGAGGGGGASMQYGSSTQSNGNAEYTPAAAGKRHSTDAGGSSSGKKKKDGGSGHGNRSQPSESGANGSKEVSIGVDIGHSGTVRAR